MEAYMPYIATVLCSILTFIGSILVNRKNQKSELLKMQKEHEYEMEKQKGDFNHKIALLEKEMSLKAETQIMADLSSRIIDAVCGSDPVKQAINAQAMRSFTSRNTHRKG